MESCIAATFTLRKFTERSWCGRGRWLCPSFEPLWTVLISISEAYSDESFVHIWSLFERGLCPFLEPLRTRIVSCSGLSLDEGCVHIWSLFRREWCTFLESLRTRVVSFPGSCSEEGCVHIRSLFGRRFRNWSFFRRCLCPPLERSTSPNLPDAPDNRPEPTEHP